MTASSRLSRLSQACSALAVGLSLLVLPELPPAAHAQAPTQKPNIMFIMGDDIGWMQPSIYHRGLMVGETPRWCMNTRTLTVIPDGKGAHRANEGRIGDPDARTVAWQTVLCPDAGTHAVQVQRIASPQNPHREISCHELA